MQQVIELQDLRRRFDSLAEKAKAGESFMVVEQAQPLFRIEPVEEIWEEVVDFTDIVSGGVPAEEVLARI